ncbi:MAG: hypothetical protein VX404_03315 [Planctomycetota bacterium]|nr:hypothetical protein [Planctomycetota bacterium]
MRSLTGILLVLLCCSPGTAQLTSESHLEIQGASGAPGLAVVTRVLISHEFDCEAFSLGVSHDPTVLSVLDMQRGEFLENSTLGGATPDFLMLESNPIVGVGYVVGCLFNLAPPINNLIAGDEQEILIITYSILPTAAVGDTQLLFTSELHDPPVVLLVVMDGLEYTPTWDPGSVTVLGDCNFNGIPDADDIASGTSEDCDGDGVPDECGYAPGQDDCNADGVPDVCEVDCNQDGIPDPCQPSLDCDQDGVLDSCEISQGLETDCDGDALPDSCAIAQGLVADCDGNAIPDSCDITAGAVDCDTDGIPDSCELIAGTDSDCDGNGILDSCDLAAGVASDCDGNGTLDSCDVTAGAPDCDLDGLLDSCAIADGLVEDCNINGVPDSCDIAAGGDQDGDGLLDVCQNDPFIRGDCNGSGFLNIADAIILLNYLFGLSSGVTCPDACDPNDDEQTNIADAIYLLAALFTGGASPLPPYPTCGDDPEGVQLLCPTYEPLCP